MLQSADHEKNKSALIDGVIRSVAKHGLEGTTARYISLYSGLNVAYIYRYFDSMENLALQAFLFSGRRIFGTACENFPLLSGDKPLSARLSAYVNRCWDYLMADVDGVQFFLRYFHCALFGDKSQAAYETIKAPLVDLARPALGEEADFLVEHLVFTVLDRVMRSARGTWPDHTENRARVLKLMEQTLSAR